MSRFFGGFALKNDRSLFVDIFDRFNIVLNEYDICGFSYGAQKALIYTLNCDTRINRLILLSPAFFNNKDSSFADSQIDIFKRNKALYLKHFYKNIGLDSLSEFREDASISDLESLLKFRFDRDKLFGIKKMGIKILIFLGGNDRIIDSTIAMDFFKDFGLVYFLKSANHLLKD